MLPTAEPIAHGLPMQRARGEVRLALRRRGPVTAIADLRQEGSLKIRFPRADAMQAVLLNTSGGVAGGDRLDIGLTLEADAAAVVTTQAAERFYRARSDDAPASVHTRVELREGAHLEWLPQEAILFDGCSLDRRLDVTMAEGAFFVGVEALVFGRAAMGEIVAHARISDTITVRRGGRLILHDATKLSGDVAAMLARPAIANGATAAATILHVSPSATGRLDMLRAALATAPVEAGASAWDGMVIARLLARDGQRLRAGIAAALAALRDGRTLPRVWSC